MKFRNVFRACICFFIIFICLICTCVSSFADSIDQGDDEYVLSSSSGITSISVRYFIGDSSGSITDNSFIDVVHSWGTFSDTLDDTEPEDTSYFETKVASREFVESIDGGRVVTQYISEMYVVPSVTARSSNAISAHFDCSLKFYLIKRTVTYIGSNAPAESEEYINCLISRLEFNFSGREYHADNDHLWSMKHSGVYSPYIIAPYDVSATVDISFDYKRFVYKRLYNSANTYNFSSLQYYNESVSISRSSKLNSGIGLSLVYNDFPKNNIYYIKDGESSIVSSPQYEYVQVLNGSTTVYFHDYVPGNIGIGLLEWYDKPLDVKQYVLPRYYGDFGSYYMSGFEFGTFLRSTVSNFLDLEIFPNLTMGGILVVILGFLLTMAIIALLTRR